MGLRIWACRHAATCLLAGPLWSRNKPAVVKEKHARGALRLPALKADGFCASASMVEWSYEFNLSVVCARDQSLGLGIRCYAHAGFT